MIYTSIQNHKIILRPSQFNHKENLLESLALLRHGHMNFQKFPLQIYFTHIYEKIPNLLSAVELATEMILNQKTIGIIGDYDVDGTVATTILVKFFNYLKIYFNFNYVYHIPNRFSEGYGPSIFAINRLNKEGVNLIITVDSGSTSYKELDLANDMSIKSIVLDHHMVQKEIPKATCFVNCQNSEEFKYLCGSGLAFVFALQLQKNLQTKQTFPPFNFTEILDLVAVATVCDFVPLIGLNRSIVHHGLKILNHQYLQTTNKLNPALHMILQYSMFHYNKNTYISSTDLGFSIGPYLNVAGRLDDANIIIRFLISENQKDLEVYFFQLQNWWVQRKKIQEEILNTIQINEVDKFILVCNENIHEGIMGIIAAKLKDKYNKPAIVIAINGEEAKGSIRGIPPFNSGLLVESAITANILIKGGGHGAAAGFSIKTNRMGDFYNFIKNNMESIHIPQEKEILVDTILSLEGLNREFYDELQKIGPFGIHNEDYIFLFPYLQIKSLYIMSGKHLSLQLSNITNTSIIKALWFFTPSIALETLLVNHIIHVVATIKYINKKIELYIIDIIIDHKIIPVEDTL